MFLTLLFSLIVAIVGEFITHLLYYSKDAYKSGIKEIEVIERKLEKNPKHTKTLQKTKQNAEIRMLKAQWKSNVVSAIFNISSLFALNSLLSGVIVAKLPFEPISLFNGITHRGIEGNDFTDCSALFIYVLSSLVFKQAISKKLGRKISKPNYEKYFQ